ncbi:hypothetical protein M407DRAFT_121147 [Tulasnella calospora MUT 4182]|uniref:Uncharacterized protein n=1 Tax=Tulasnella calospora MUT 4182 TaxID=1051891 RepID=A0A0C3LL03_9AGAM|nr:hypothetical protein M407DRAFT_121147 [Tulasnella calospora MUT 4182]
MHTPSILFRTLHHSLGCDLLITFVSMGLKVTNLIDVISLSRYSTVCRACNPTAKRKSAKANYTKKVHSAVRG